MNDLTQPEKPSCSHTLNINEMPKHGQGNYADPNYGGMNHNSMLFNYSGVIPSNKHVMELPKGFIAKFNIGEIPCGWTEVPNSSDFMSHSSTLILASKD